MANFTYLRDEDSIVRLAQVSASSSDTNYPITNISALPVSKPWRSAEGQIDDVKVRMDFAVAQTIDTLSLVNHNFSSTATITLRGGTSPDPDGTDFNTTITWAEFNAWKLLASTESWRYWTILLNDESNVFGFLQIGYLVFGDATVLAFNFEPQWELERMSAVRVIENEIGVPMVGARLSGHTVLRISFTTRTDAQKDTLETFLASLKRETKPLLFLPDSAETEAFFGRLVINHLTERHAKWNDIRDLEFREDAHGVMVEEDPPFHYKPA